MGKNSAIKRQTAKLAVCQVCMKGKNMGQKYGDRSMGTEYGDRIWG